MFENDVKTYGTETWDTRQEFIFTFENDVKTYGTETAVISACADCRLRMM